MNKIKEYKKELLKARKRSLAFFSDMNHRLESLGLINGVEWINDSKATDLESTHYALSLFKQPVTWIVESSRLDKDYSVLEKLVRYNVKSIVCYGEHETNIKETLGGIVVNYIHEDTLEKAVLIAEDLSEKNEVVLFSPACPTANNYDSYKERGQEFIRFVSNLKE